MQLTFISGWAGFPQLYPQLSAGSCFVTPFFQHTGDDVREAIVAGGDTLVGWSTGAHLILSHLEQAQRAFSRIILVAPFLAFSDSVSPRVLKRMKLRLKQDPENTVSDFWQLCGLKSSCPQLDARQVGQLAAGLDFLASSAIISPLPVAQNLTLVHCSKDQVVSETAFAAVAEALPAAEMRKVATPHLVPETQLVRMIADDRD